VEYVMNDITGRDSYIMARALYWAIAYSQSLPEDQRERSDEQDMKAILLGRFGNAYESFIAIDKALGRTPPELFDEKPRP
jgi:hypothetical protein